MLFNSWVFLKFLAAFLLLYWLVRHDLRARNLLILAGSYVFYGYWDVRFLFLLLASTLLDYVVGQALAQVKAQRSRRWLLALSMAGNLGILGFFKYYGFFVESLAELLAQLGWQANLTTLKIVLPVGISFYTFQTMSYTIDIYRGELRPSRNLVEFAAYVAFFPQLVAGPIERARHLLPQFSRTHHITLPMVEEGTGLILWGMFKKVVVADNLAPLADMAFDPALTPSAPVIVLGMLAFGFQIYADFSGYSDIARGLARWLGFDLMVNFNLPYFAASLREFWHRWHISLSTWLRDYLYISLGGNRGGSARTVRNLMLTMVLGGLWHGAGWNFVLWGLFHGLGLALQHGWSTLSPKTIQSALPTARMRLLGQGFTFLYVFYGWLLFRAESLDQIKAMTLGLGRWTGPVWWNSLGWNLLAFAGPLLAIDLWQHRAGSGHPLLGRKPWLKGLLQGLALLGIILYWEKGDTPFLYFQF